MKLTFKIFHISAKPENATKAIKKMKKHNNADFEIIKVEKYLNKGSLALCETTIKSIEWKDKVFEVLKFAQTFGLSWSISGDIEEEINISTTRFSAGDGVSLADIQLTKTENSRTNGST